MMKKPFKDPYWDEELHKFHSEPGYKPHTAKMPFEELDKFFKNFDRKKYELFEQHMCAKGICKVFYREKK